MRPRATVEQERKQRRLTNLVDTSVRRLWAQMRGRTWGNAWRDDVGPKVVQVVTRGQVAAARASDTYVTAVLTELGMGGAVATTMDHDALSGVTGGGVPALDAGAALVVQMAQSQYTPSMRGLPPQEVINDALAEGERLIAEMAASMMADAMRAAEQVAMVERPWLDGYIRVIEPGACSRCAVLAGKFYLFNAGFPRHPRCRCDHVPAPRDPERRKALMATESPERYFESLSEAEQNVIFTNDGAEAIRLGADIGQVVNARKGMSTAQGPTGRKSLTTVDLYGRRVHVTLTGTTRRGVAHTRLTADRKRGDQTPVVRLMPESIIASTDNAEERIRLLKLHGYIT